MEAGELEIRIMVFATQEWQALQRRPVTSSRDSGEPANRLRIAERLAFKDSAAEESEMPPIGCSGCPHAVDHLGSRSK